MKWYRGPEGDERLWLERSEIETIMEDELRKAGLLPNTDQPVVDIERFLEAHLHLEVDQYASLEADVLGLTEFRPRKPPRVLINRDLTGSAMDADWVPPGVQGRWRATLAHEGTHVVLHRPLFELNADQGLLFETEPGRPRSHQMMRCLKREVAFGARASDWREVQANRGMAALLMPRSVFLTAAKVEMRQARIVGSRVPAASEQLLGVARGLAERFEVSRQAATIRLATFGFVADPAAAHLAV